MSLDLTEEQYNGLTETEKRVFTQNDTGISLTVTEDFFKNSDDVTKTLNAKKAANEEHKVTKSKLTESITKNQELESMIADFKLQGSKSDEELQKRLDEAMAIKIAPFETRAREHMEKENTMSDEIERYKADNIQNRLKDEIRKAIDDEKSTLKSSSFQDIYSRALRSDIGLTLNKDVDNFVGKDNSSFADWLTNQAKNSEWNKPSKSAGALGGGKGVGGDSDKPQTAKEIMNDVWKT
jgi:hypothetical protein